MSKTGAASPRLLMPFLFILQKHSSRIEQVGRVECLLQLVASRTAPEPSSRSALGPAGSPHRHAESLGLRSPRSDGLSRLDVAGQLADDDAIAALRQYGDAQSRGLFLECRRLSREAWSPEMRELRRRSTELAERRPQPLRFRVREPTETLFRMAGPSSCCQVSACQSVSRTEPSNRPR